MPGDPQCVTTNEVGSEVLGRAGGQHDDDFGFFGERHPCSTRTRRATHRVAVYQVAAARRASKAAACSRSARHASSTLTSAKRTFSDSESCPTSDRSALITTATTG